VSASYAILIRSKHTGQEILLGARYLTRELALAAAEVDVCPRCNSFEIVPRWDDP
jgi:hypothetical protein